MSLDPAVAAVRLAVRHALRDSTDPVLVACSGGADSLALLAATVFEAGKVHVGVVGVTVDHGLQDGSAARTVEVVEQMAGLGVDETVSVRVDVTAAGQGPEAAAREARYAVLAEVAERFGGATVLLGHTLDDQAETVLLGLARGSGGRSLAGMRRVRPPFVRPLLDVTRARTEAACRAEGIAWWCDPHNADARFARSRVRHRVLPVLEAELGPGVAQALARTADQVAADTHALDEIAHRVWIEVGTLTPALGTQPRAVLLRVLRLAALDAGSIASELTYAHVLAVSELVHGPESPLRHKQVQLPGHVTAYREGDLLKFRGTPVSG